MGSSISIPFFYGFSHTPKQDRGPQLQTQSVPCVEGISDGVCHHPWRVGTVLRLLACSALQPSRLPQPACRGWSKIMHSRLLWFLRQSPNAMLVPCPRCGTQTPHSNAWRVRVGIRCPPDSISETLFVDQDFGRGQISIMVQDKCSYRSKGS